jgi:hypothetical protein
MGFHGLLQGSFSFMKLMHKDEIRKQSEGSWEEEENMHIFHYTYMFCPSHLNNFVVRR